MDVDLIICRILHYSSKIHKQNLCRINHQWNRMISYLYPHKHVWEENSKIISQLSIPTIDTSSYRLVFSKFCEGTGLEINLLELDKTIFVRFSDCTLKNSFFKQEPITKFFLFLEFNRVVIPKQLTKDGVYHYIICLRSIEGCTFVDYTDLNNICVYKKTYKENPKVNSSSLHYLLGLNFNLTNDFEADMDLSCLPFVNLDLLSQEFDYDFADAETQTFPNVDGSFFVIKSNIISLENTGSDMVTSMKFNSFLSKAKINFACGKFIIVSDTKFVTIFNIFTQECILLFSMKQTDEIVQVINLTSSHFLLLLFSNTSVSADDGFKNNIDFYCLVDGDRAKYKKIIKNPFIKNEFAPFFKVEQKSDKVVSLHYVSHFAANIHQIVSFDLKNLCLV